MEAAHILWTFKSAVSGCDLGVSSYLAGFMLSTTTESLEGEKCRLTGRRYRSSMKRERERGLEACYEESFIMFWSADLSHKPFFTPFMRFPTTDYNNEEQSSRAQTLQRMIHVQVSFSQNLKSLLPRQASTVNQTGSLFFVYYLSEIIIHEIKT